MNGFGAALRTRLRPTRLLLAGVLAIVVWELAAVFLRSDSRHASYILPTVAEIISSFKGLSDFWTGGLGVPAPRYGGPETLLGALLALGDGALATLEHLLAGLALGVSAGVGLGVLIGGVRTARLTIYAPAVLIAQIPNFALLPLFQFWFGATDRGAIIFIAFGSGVLLLRATVAAVENVPAQQVMCARTLGASGLRLYRTIVVPAILVELRAAGVLALTLAWTLALGGELIGVPRGLGHMLANAATFSQVGQMVFIAGLFVVMAAGSIVAFTAAAERALQWAR